MADFGYDVSDYVGIDPLFGTMDDFDALLRGVHERGMKLLLDFVRCGRPCTTACASGWIAAWTASTST
jgi:glycosidase